MFFTLKGNFLCSFSVFACLLRMLYPLDPLWLLRSSIMLPCFGCCCWVFSSSVASRVLVFMNSASNAKAGNCIVWAFIYVNCSTFCGFSLIKHLLQCHFCCCSFIHFNRNVSSNNNNRKHDGESLIEHRFLWKFCHLF